ncbi:MAG: hypothetical protein M0026_18265 [Nocardiopsaceae bacterium]|nr:hypothetical protein [Nocardiopsaceae bacterium]
MGKGGFVDVFAPQARRDEEYLEGRHRARPGIEVVRADAGDSGEAGHRTITVHRVDEGGDEGIAVTIEGMEAPTPDSGTTRPWENRA